MTLMKLKIFTNYNLPCTILFSNLQYDWKKIKKREKKNWKGGKVEPWGSINTWIKATTSPTAPTRCSLSTNHMCTCSEHPFGYHMSGFPLDPHNVVFWYCGRQHESGTMFLPFHAWISYLKAVEWLMAKVVGLYNHVFPIISIISCLLK